MKMEPKDTIYTIAWKPSELKDVPFETIAEVCLDPCIQSKTLYTPLNTPIRTIYAKVVEITRSAVILSLKTEDLQEALPFLTTLMEKINRIITLYQGYQLCQKIEEGARAREG